MEIKYPHIKFAKQWELSTETIYELGQCQAIIQSISNTPIKPTYYEELLHISLVKGAQATTAIEGNTLSLEEIENIEKGDSLPPSKEYQEIEVKNILEAFNMLLDEVVKNDKGEIITTNIIKRFNYIVGKNLGDYFQAQPGQFRNVNVSVGIYRAPDYQDVPELMERYCKWLIEEFHYEKGQVFRESIIQAIVSHIYLEWIHPFGDGNGRTGRLLEFYLLLRSGNPDIASHILSNFYNETRNEYYRQLHLSSLNQDLSNFISYAVKGFRDGLLLTLQKIQKSNFEIAWHHFIFTKFKESRTSIKKEVTNRRQELILSIPINQAFTQLEIIGSNPQLIRLYSPLSNRTLARDIKVLLKLNLLIEKDGKYEANTYILKTRTAQRRKNPKIKQY